MVELNLDDRSAATPDRGVNWALYVSIGIAVLGWIFAGIGDYRNNDQRITKLEAQRESDTHRLERLENKIDRILERVK